MNKTHHAIIYCRVSSVAQLQKGDGLASQETRCRDYARMKGYQVCKVFKDEGASGSLIERPAMQAMLGFLRQSDKDQYFVLIDDISRLARGLEAHIQLRTAISAAGGKLESPSIEFGDDSDSVLVEHLLASVSQHQRQKNAEQTLNRMKARAMNGYWVFNPPMGYKYAKVNGHSGQVLVRDEPVASVVTEALEGFASGRFATQAEVKRFLDHAVCYPKDNSGEVRFQRVTNLLNKVIYTGYMEVPRWDIPLKQGQHEALIDFSTWQAIQQRLHGKAKVTLRNDINEDFPLRGFVLCNACNHPMTACWSKGRKSHYAYYLCFKKGCINYRKSVRKEQMESEFEQLLQQATPTAPLFDMAQAMFRALWNDQAKNRDQQATSIERELQQTDKKVQMLLDRVVETDSPALIKNYEQKIQTLEEQKIVLTEQRAQCGTALPDYDETFRTALGFLKNPHKLWASKRLADKRTVLKLVFAEPLAYDRQEGFRTAAFALPFKVLHDLQRPDYDMAEKEGFEPSIRY